MTDRMSIEQYRHLVKRCTLTLRDQQMQRLANKYGAQPTVNQGMRFASKLEARRYRYWEAILKAGGIRWFTRQVPFALPGGITYRCDFLIALNAPDVDHTWIRIEDCKGIITEASTNKIKQVEAIYHVTVHLVRKEDF